MSGGRAKPIVDLPQPSPEVRRSVTRLLVDIFARRALVELGVLAANDNDELRR